MQGMFSGDAHFPLFHRLRRLLRLTLAQAIAPSVFPVALLIDGDNHAGMSSELLAHILVEAGKLGAVVIRKVYGNWREPTMDKWKDLSLHYALEPVHYAQATAVGKNGADIALSLDALDLYRCQGIMHFCLVASDSDYLPLIRRLRANGCIVVLIGKATTPSALKTSTLFIDLEHLDTLKSYKGRSPIGSRSNNSNNRLIRSGCPFFNQWTINFILTQGQYNAQGQYAKLTSEARCTKNIVDQSL